jgi:surface protein
LETLTIGTWNVSGVTDFSNMFEKCYALKNIDIENWDVKKAKKMTAMFRTCNALTELDLSGWKTENLINTKIMFENSSNLTTIYVGDGWDMADVTASADMFNGCTSLVGGTGTVYNSANVDQNYANYTTGYLTKKSA